jgi:ribosomal silencing factor RsfS
MSERLTDEDLAYIERRARGDLADEILGEDLLTMLAELRERRAADITPEEVEALRALHDYLVDDVAPSARHENRALAILDRLTTNGGKP